jgi:hypothetical protein
MSDLAKPARNTSARFCRTNGYGLAHIGRHTIMVKKA